MITFHGGPANGSILTLKRAPLLLRVVVDAEKNVDALDHFDDQPRPGERVFVYKLIGTPTSYRLYGARDVTGWYVDATYHFAVIKVEAATLRSTAAWRRWALACKTDNLELDTGVSQMTLFNDEGNNDAQ